MFFTLRILIVLLLSLFIPSSVTAHPLPLSQARLQIDSAKQTYDLIIDCDVTALVMGHAAGHLSEDLASQLAALSGEDLKREIDRKREWFASQLEITVDREKAEPVSITFPDVKAIRETRIGRGGEIETQHETVHITGRIRAGAHGLTLRLPREIGAVLLIARRDAMDLSPQLLAAGQQCQPLPLTDEPLDPPKQQSPENQGETEAGDGHSIPPGVITAGQFLALGFWHIIPQGLDHILFVLGLFLLSPALKPLLWQVTAFTVAHSATLAMAMCGIVRLPSEIVEPLIAASIVVIAIENLFTSKLNPWRPIVVFAFGLLHGLGFAGVLSDLSLPAGQFAPAIIGFNLGVEVGQLAVIGLAFLSVGWLRKSKAYRPAVVIPASLAIAAFGIVWVIERTLLG